MKIIITGISSLEELMMSLPFVKGLRDSKPDADIFIFGPDHYSKIRDFCPYISGVVSDSSINIFDEIIDIKNMDVTFSKMHFTDRLLQKLPTEFRRRQIILKDTINGLDAIHDMDDDNFDLVIYPYQANQSLFWEEKNFVQFLTYFFQMNPGKKVCVVGFEHHRDDLEKKFLKEIYPQGLLIVEICSLDKMLSLMKRSSHILVADSAIKNLANNEASVLIEVRGEGSYNFMYDCSYKENNYLINFKSQIKNKIVFTYDEMVFDNHAHFLSYVVTSILDEDEEKLRWFADNYGNVVDICKSRMDPDLGLRILPVHWSPAAILRSLVEISLRMKFLKISKPHFAEDFYYSIHDDSDFSQEKIMYDFGHIQKYLEHLLDFFRNSNEFSRQMKLKNFSPNSLDEAIFSQTQSRDDIVTILFFIRQVMNVSSHKLLENLPMTASYYS